MSALSEDVTRCFGSPDDPLMMRYHDKEWGVPVHNDKLLFEFLCLEGAQAGLSWQTILNKRENYRIAFDNFDPGKIAKYTDREKKRLLANEGIVRNRLKVDAFIGNAQQFLCLQKEFGSFDKFIWQFTSQEGYRRPGEVTFENIPAMSPQSHDMSKELKKRGFRFVGPTICYAFMQAVGMVNDHVSNCFLAPKPLAP